VITAVVLLGAHLLQPPEKVIGEPILFQWMERMGSCESFNRCRPVGVRCQRKTELLSIRVTKVSRFKCFGGYHRIAPMLNEAPAFSASRCFWDSSCPCGCEKLSVSVSRRGFGGECLSRPSRLII